MLAIQSDIVDHCSYTQGVIACQTSGFIDLSVKPRFFLRNANINFLSEFRDVFKLFDKDADGYITEKELGVVMSGLGKHMPDDQLHEMFSKADLRGNLQILILRYIRVQEL